jgi:hypothetical protein
MCQKRTVTNNMHHAQMQLIMILYGLITSLVHLMTIQPLPRLNFHEFCFGFGKHVNHEKVLV